MIYSPEYQAMINVARTYAEGYKKPDKAMLGKMRTQAEGKPQTEKGDKQYKKMETVRKVLSDPDMRSIAGDAAKGVEKSNRLRGQAKALGRAYDNSGKEADDAKVSLQKKAAEAALKAKIKRPKTRLPKTDRPGTIKKK